MSAPRALLCDDDASFRERLALSLSRRGWEARTAGDPASALESAREFRPTHALLDLRMGAESGLDLIPPLLALRPDLRVVVLTGYGSIASALEAVRLGACDYLTKPADTGQVVAAFEGRDRGTEPMEVPSLDRVEWEHLQRILADCGGNVSQAARLLGLDRRSLQRKLARFPPPR